MISCFLHRFEFNRHVDDAAALSSRAKSHLEKCPACRERFELQARFAARLRVSNTDHVEVPPFLHTRVMAAVRNSAQSRAERSVFKIAAITTSFAAIAIAASLLLSERPSQQAAKWPDFPTQIAFKTKLPENPLETEIENLRKDTLNAAKALAASFLPDDGAK